MVLERTIACLLKEAWQIWSGFRKFCSLVDNAYDPDVKASQLWIDKLHLRGKTCLTFSDNGNGMTPEKLHKMLR